MARTPKGEIAIKDSDGWIQLVWRYQGQRKYLSPGLPYEPINLAVARRLADQIKLDMISNNFDHSLEKYRGDRSSDSGKEIGAVALFEKFIEFKSKKVQARTLEKYHGLTIWLKDFYRDRPATSKDTEDFIDWLKENMQPVTSQERLGLLKAAWEWGTAQTLVKDNPWEELMIRKPPKQKPKAFTKDEVARIIKGLENNRYYRYYSDYIRFKFSCGCRTGEANGLRWKHLNDDCSVVWFGEAHTHGQFKETKTSRDREVKLSSSLTAMLLARRPNDCDPDNLVFPAPEGGAIHEGNFGKRAWKKTLEASEIKYRSPYNTRHTFISHALESGMNPVEVAQITGHDVKTLYQNYAGLIKSHPTTPELF